MRKVGYSNPRRDRPKVVEAGSDTATAKLSSEMTIIYRCPGLQKVWHAKDPSLLTDHKVLSIGYYLKFFTGNDCLHISENFSRGMINKQTNKHESNVIKTYHVQHPMYRFGSQIIIKIEGIQQLVFLCMRHLHSLGNV